MKISFPFVLFLITLVVYSGCDSDPKVSTTPTSPTSAPSAAASSFPLAEAEKLIQRLATQDGSKDSTAEMRLSFTDAEGKPQQIDFRLQRKYEAGKISTLMTVLAPKEDSEKALLAFEEEGKPTDAISYLAGLKKTAHLKSDNPLNFRGSRSTVQEMLGLELGKYDITSTETGVPQNDEITIHLSEKKGMNLAFPKLAVSFRKTPKYVTQVPEGTFLPSLFVLSDSKDQAVKKMEVMHVDFSGAANKYKPIKSIEITDLKNNQKLKLETRSIKYDTNLPSSIFTEAQLIKNVTAATAKLVQ